MKNEEIERKLKRILKSAGVNEVNIVYDNNVGCYKTIRVLTPEEINTIPSYFVNTLTSEKLKGSVTKFDDTEDIWIFKLYE